jgi:hypothetical protein
MHPELAAVILPEIPDFPATTAGFSLVAQDRNTYETLSTCCAMIYPTGYPSVRMGLTAIAVGRAFQTTSQPGPSTINGSE